MLQPRTQSHKKYLQCFSWKIIYEYLIPLYCVISCPCDLILYTLLSKLIGKGKPDWGGLNLKSVTLHTDLGDIKIELFCEACPKACQNFLALCASDYYNGCIFHRNIKGFIVQTGDPTKTGKGGESIWGRKFEDEFKDELKHKERGMVSMANNGPNTNGSQFFITYGPQPHLDLKYTVFGKVIDGFDVLDELEKVPVNPKNFKPFTNIKICDATIHANPLAG